MKKLFILSFVLAILAATSSAQEKPFRVGLKFGLPNIVGLNAEYATPILGGRLAPSLDFSYFSINVAGTKSSFSYFELGPLVYFKSDGKGPYAGLTYGRIGFKGSYTDPSLGDGEGSLGINRVNIKLGGKFGGGFYFRPEIGWALRVGDSKVKVKYTDTNGQVTTQTETVPGFLGGGIIFNIGFGVAF